MQGTKPAEAREENKSKTIYKDKENMLRENVFDQLLKNVMFSLTFLPLDQSKTKQKYVKNFTDERGVSV